MKIGIISLGCPKNLVDSEALLGEFTKKGHKIVDEIAKADIAIVNTCAFIEDAKKESIDAILNLVELKKQGSIKKIIVAGCLPQRYPDILKKEFKEVDTFKGVEEILKQDMRDRFLITPLHYAYIKISDGCDNCCKYCVISKIRGSYKSRPVKSIQEEIVSLYKNSRGALKEINLVSQDLTYYGTDLYGRLSLVKLLRRLENKDFTEKTRNLKWVRLLYAHPAHFTDELIEIMASSGRICKYIDLPFQHISDKILKSMGRKVIKHDIINLIEKLRARIPGIAIRTSFIVGLPGEGEKEFKELLKFMKDMKFERLGIFIYSREEGTAAYNFKNQVSQKEKSLRFDEAMLIQQDIARQVNAEFLGRKMEVLIEEQDHKDKNIYIGRSYADAPEVDGQVYVNVGAGSLACRGSWPGQAKPAPTLKPGDFVTVKITDTMEYDLAGEYEPSK